MRAVSDSVDSLVTVTVMEKHLGEGLSAGSKVCDYAQYIGSKMAALISFLSFSNHLQHFCAVDVSSICLLLLVLFSLITG